MVGTAGDSIYIYLRVLPERLNTLTTLLKIDSQIIHIFTFRTHLLSTLEFRYMLKDPSRFSRPCVHSVLKKT